VTALEAQVLDISSDGFRDLRAVEGEQGNQRLLTRRREPGGDEQGADLVAVQGGGVRLVVQPRPPRLGGGQFFLGRLLVEPGDGAQPGLIRLSLWNVATLKEIGAPITADSDSGAGSVNAGAFRPDGKTLATEGSDGTARLWDVGFPSNPLPTVCAIAGSSQTPEQWNFYFQTVLHRPICHYSGYRPEIPSPDNANQDLIKKLTNEIQTSA
jgi:hypothetical protein